MYVQIKRCLSAVELLKIWNWKPNLSFPRKRESRTFVVANPRLPAGRQAFQAGSNSHIFVSLRVSNFCFSKIAYEAIFILVEIAASLRLPALPAGRQAAGRLLAKTKTSKIHSYDPVWCPWVSIAAIDSLLFYSCFGSIFRGLNLSRKKLLFLRR